MDRIGRLLFVLVYMSCVPCSYSLYLATFPNALYPGIAMNGSVNIYGATSSVTVNTELLQETNGVTTVISDVSIEIDPASPIGQIIVPVPNELDSGSIYRLRITGSGGATFVNESIVKLDENGLLILIQSDKSRYSAGQTVKFRVIHLLPNLMNYMGTSTITFLDGKGNKIRVIGPHTVDGGVLNGSFILSEEPVFGTWKIHVSANGVEETNHFDVYDYVLPRFSVGIAIPSVERTASNFNINVTARFTFGTDVHGSCVLQIYNENQKYNFLNLTQQIMGKATFHVSMSELQNNLNMDGKINVRALVTDNATFLTMVAEKELKLVVTPALSIQVKQDQEYYVAGCQYYTAVFIGRGTDPLGTTGTIRVQPTVYTYEEKTCRLSSPSYQWIEVQSTAMDEFTINFDETGYASLTIPTNLQSTAERIEFRLSYGDATSNSLKTTLLTKTTNLFMRMAPSKPCGQVGDAIIINTVTTSPITGYVIYEVYSRGLCIFSQRVYINNLAQHNFVLHLTENMVPKAKVIASHVTSSGKIISDHFTIWTLGNPFRNRVNVTLSSANASPKDTVNVTVSADPNSVVYILAEDERNRLLGTHNDVFYQTVVDSVGEMGSSYSNSRRKREAQQASGDVQKDGEIQIKRMRRSRRIKRNTRAISNSFQVTGIVLLTDVGAFPQSYGDQMLSSSWLSTSCVAQPDYGGDISWIISAIYPVLPQELPGGSVIPEQLPVPTPPEELPLGDIIRSRFPETWIWDSFPVGDAGVINITQTVPDTMTSWVISTMATSPNTGFGITEIKPKITVRKTLFATLDLPKEIVKGEEVLLQVTVFNYSPQSTMQFVYLMVVSSDGSSFVGAVMVPANQGTSSIFPYTPSVTGIVEIRVSVMVFFGQTKVDDVIKTMNVIPSGVHVTRNDQYLVDVVDGNINFKRISIETPQNTIAGTRKARISISGDLMVPSIKGLHNLIRLPYGCGEQTMLNFAPAVFIANYLQTVNKLTDEILAKSLTTLQKGYQNEMKYRHDDGSFSAFGNRDPSGSTWLTAFVLKCFGEANEFMPVDNAVMSAGLRWLLQYQQSDGSFTEPGRVIHKTMQSGTNSGDKLTAYILVSIMENRDIHVTGHDIDQAISNGRRYLESRMSLVNDVYTLALMCYALANTESQYRSTCFTKLNVTALVDDDKMYWRASTPVHIRKRSTTSRASSIDIEATSYSLLTYIHLGKMTEALAIVKWLVSQRTTSGGYQSTQDTVVSLQALAEFSSRRPASPPDYEVTVHTVGSFDFIDTYTATPRTFDLFHTVQIPDNVTSVAVTSSGQGAALVDVSWSYYVADSTTNDNIGVYVTLTEDTVNAVTVRPCISWKSYASSGMIVMVVEMPTGFQAEPDVLKGQSIIKRFDTNGRKLNLYFDGMGRSTTCVNVKLTRRDPVVKSQACHVTVYDYYQPMHQATTRYESGILKNSTICDLCPHCGVCTSGTLTGKK